MNFEQISQKIKKSTRMVSRFFIGDEYAEDTIVERAMDLSVYRYPSFSKELNYRYFSNEGNVFINQHNAGILYRIVPLTGADEGLAEQLDSLLRTKISEHHTFQVISLTHNKVGHELDSCAAQFEQEGFVELSSLGQHLSRYWKKAAVSKFNTQNEVVAKLNNTEVYLVIDKVFDEDFSNLNESAILADFAVFRRGFETALTAANIGYRLANAEDLLKLSSFFLNPELNNLYPKKPSYDDELVINEQLTNKDFFCEVTEDGLYLKGSNDSLTAVSVMTLTEPPQEHALWLNLDLTNNVNEKSTSINCNHIISVIYKVEPQATALFRANRKTKSLNKKANSVYAFNVAGTSERAREWKGFRDDIALKKTKSVKVLYNLVLFSHPENKAQDIQNAKTSFAYSGISLSLCKKQQPPYFLVSMPFMFTGYLEKDFSLPMMMTPFSSWNGVQLMPLLADWSGNPKGILLPTLRNQVSFLDPFSGAFGTGFNIVVSGTTRAGKSFLMQYMMQNVLFNGGDVFIIDVGGSYKKLTKLLGGVYLEYENLAMNPFTHINDIGNDIDGLINLFGLLVWPKTGANEDDRGTLRRAILNAFDEKKNATLIDDVRASLLALYDLEPNIYSTAGVMAKNLEPYCMDAEHGKVFNLPSKLDPNARMIVVDLKALQKKENIKLPALLSIITQFQRRMFDSDRSKQKMCIFDEAWQFIQDNPVASAYLIEGYRTGSRHMCSFVTITQGIMDFERLGNAQVLWENAALKLIFKQEATSLEKYNKGSNLLTDYELKLLQTFPKPQEVGYSEVLVKADRFSSFHRLFVDPFTLVSLSSEGRDFQAVENYVQLGLSYVDAISQVATNHYGAMYA